MDAEEFIAKFKPKPRSQVAQYYEDLVKLKAAGCTIKQLQNFLELNNLFVSCSAIDQYLKRKEKKRISGRSAQGSRPAHEGNKEPGPIVEGAPDKPQNITKLADKDELARIKNHKRGS